MAQPTWESSIQTAAWGGGGVIGILTSDQICQSLYCGFVLFLIAASLIFSLQLFIVSLL